MMTSRTFSENPDFRKEFKVTRFLWKVTELYQVAKKDRRLDAAFWQQFRKALDTFDAKYPTSHRTPATRVSPVVTHGAERSRSPRSPLPPTPAPLEPTRLIPQRQATPVAPIATKHIQSVVTHGAGPSQSRRTPDSSNASRDPTPSPPPLVNRPWIPSGPAPSHICPKKPIPSPSPVTEQDRSKVDKGKKRKVDEVGVQPRPVAEKGMIRRERSRDVEEYDGDTPKVKERSKKDDESEDEENVKVVVVKRKQPKTSGRLRDRTCKRCERLNYKCLVQSGGRACLACAKVKVRCEDLEEDEEGRLTPEPAPMRNPAPITYIRPVSQAAVAAPSQEPVIKSKPPPRTPAPTSLPAPTKKPAPAKRKRTKKAPKSTVEVESDEDDGEVRRKKKKTFGELSNGSGECHLSPPKMRINILIFR